MSEKLAVYVALGSNLGDRLKNLQEACKRIENMIAPIQHKSSIYLTKPWGFEAATDFYNAAITLLTDLKPGQLLSLLKKIEVDMGRSPKTGIQYESRIIDLDIIDFSGIIFQNPELNIPHPQLDRRLFVCLPLKDLNATWKHPITQKKITEIISSLPNDETPVKLEGLEL